jgi:putative permease
MTTPFSHRPSVKVAALVLLLSASFAVACVFPALLVALILAILLAFVLKPLVRFFEISVGLNRTTSIVVVFVLLGGFAFFNGMHGIPVVIDSMRDLYQRFQHFPLDQKIDELVGGLASTIPVIDPHAASLKVRAIIGSGLISAGQSVKAAAGSMFSFFIIPFVMYFALAEGDRATKRLLERVPNKYFEMTLNVVDKIQKDLIGYLRGWILDSVIVGIVNIIGYYIIGVNYPILLGIVAGIANLIPYVGPFVGVIPAFIVGATQTGDLSMVTPIVVLLLAVQTIDNIIIQPLCFSKTVDMHPLTVIVVLIVGNQLLGVLGMLLAIPIYTVLKVTAVESYWGLKHYRITS